MTQSKHTPEVDVLANLLWTDAMWLAIYGRDCSEESDEDVATAGLRLERIAERLTSYLKAAHETIAAVKDIAGLLTWNECAGATPQVRMTKADISNALDHAILSARAAIAKAAAGEKANAHLIAAAPDMLAALLNVRALISEAAQTGFNWKDGDWTERLYASQQATSAAIAKATS